MLQYQQKSTAVKVKPAAKPEPTLAEQQLMAVVQRLSLLTEQQSRQIRRLESELNQVKETVNRRLR